MSPQFESVKREALTLPLNEREALAEQLELSVRGASEKEIEEAWAKLANRRYQNYKEGKSVLYEVKDVIAEARKRVKR